MSSFVSYYLLTGYRFLCNKALYYYTFTILLYLPESHQEAKSVEADSYGCGIVAT